MLEISITGKCVNWKLNVMLGSGSSTFAARAIVTFASAFLNWPLNSLPFFYSCTLSSTSPPLLLALCLMCMLLFSAAFWHLSAITWSGNWVSAVGPCCQCISPSLALLSLYNPVSIYLPGSFILSMLSLTLLTKPLPTWLNFSITAYHVTYN